MDKTKEIIKQAGIYSFSTQIAQCISLVAAILCRRFLGPVQMGLWSTLQIVVDYSKYVTLGVITASSREIPYLVGKGQLEEAQKIKDLTFTFIVIGSLIVASGVCLFAFVTRGKFSEEVTIGLFFVAGIVFLQRINNLYIVLLRSHKQFLLASKQMIYSAIVNATLVGVLTYHFKIYGFIWSLGLSLVFNIVYIHLHYQFHFRWFFESKLVRSMILFGFPVLMIGILMTVFRSVDRIMIVKNLGFEALGLYSVAIMVCNFGGGVAISISVVLFPHFQEKYGERDDVGDLENYLYKSSLGLSLIMPMIIGLAWILVPFAIILLLPQYALGIQAMQYLSLSLFSIALIEPYHHFLITIKKHLQLFPLLGLACLTAVCLDYFAIRLNFGIVGVSCVTSLTLLVYFSLLYFVSSRYLISGLAAVKKYFVFLSPTIYLFAVLFVINYLVESDPSSITRTGTQLALFVGFCVPLFVILNHQFSILALIRERFVKKG